MLRKLKKSCTPSQRGHSTKMENHLDERFVTEIINMDKVINELNYNLAKFKELSLRNGKGKLEGEKRRFSSPEKSKSVEYMFESISPLRSASDSTINRTATVTTGLTKSKNYVMNTASYGRSALRSNNDNYPHFLEKSKSHPLILKGRKKSKTSKCQNKLGDHHNSCQVSSKQTTDEATCRNLEALGGNDQNAKLCKSKASKEYMVVDELFAIEKSGSHPDTLPARTRKLGTVQVPIVERLEMQKGQTIKSSGEERIPFKSFGNERKLHRNSTGRRSLRRNLLERRITIAQCNFQLQNQLENQNSSKEKSRLSKRVSFDSIIKVSS